MHLLILILFLGKDIKLYVPVVTLSRRDNQKLLKHLSKTRQYKYFLDSSFVGVNRLILMSIVNDLKLENIIYQKT